MFWIARSFSVVLHFPAHIFLRLLPRSYRSGFHCHLSRLFRRNLFPAVCLYQRVSVSRMPYPGIISISLYKSILPYPVVITSLLNRVKVVEQRHSGMLSSGYGCHLQGVTCTTCPAWPGALRENVTRERSPCQRGSALFLGGSVPASRISMDYSGQMNPEIE